MTYTFDEKDLGEIEKIKAKYPTNQSALLPVLWYAQDKFGHVDKDVQQLVATTLDIHPSQVYGVASFYTQYYKEKKGKYVLDVCTCFTCQACGGYDMLHYIEDKLGIKAGETTPDGKFTVQSVECLGACGYAPMLQVTNDVYVNHLSKEKIDELIDNLNADKLPEFDSMIPSQIQQGE